MAKEEEKKEAATPPKAEEKAGGGISPFADSLAGLSVALIVIPQGMAYAELAGMPPVTGLFASALPSVAAAFFASSPFLQTGPVALTSLLTFAALTAIPGLEIASPEYVAMATLLALVVGATRVGIGLLKAGPVSYLMSAPVLRGFTNAAGILIFSSQLPKVFGVTNVGDGSVLEKAFTALTAFDQWDLTAIGLSAMTVALMLGGRKVHKLFPGVLLAVVIGIAYSMMMGYEGPVVGEIPAAFIPPFVDSVANTPWSALPQILVSGVVIALVGFAEAASVSQAFAEDARDPWDPNKEFVSQGIANLASGVSGGFPVGGSFSRSAVNRLAGARSKYAGLFSGVFVFAFIPFASYLAPLPTAILGAIVFAAVLKLLNPMPWISLWKQSPPQAFIGTATFVLTLALAPKVEQAVLAGVGLAMAIHVWREQQYEVRHCVAGDTVRIEPLGVLWFGSAPMMRQAMIDELAQHKEVDTLILDLGSIGRLDLTGAMVIEEVVAAAKRSKVEVQFAPLPPHTVRLMNKLLPDIKRLDTIPADFAALRSEEEAEPA